LFGFTDGMGAKAQRIFGAPLELDRHDTENTGDPTEEASESSGGGTSGRADAISGGPPGGPTPFPFTDEALADRFAAHHRDWRYAEDQGWVRLETGVYIPHPGVIQPISRMCSAVGEPYRAQGRNGA